MGKKDKEKLKKRYEGKIKIPKTVVSFCAEDWKGFKKHHMDEYESKKEAKFAYYEDLNEYLPDVIEFMVKYGHIKDANVQNVKEDVHHKLVDAGFIKFLKEELEDGIELPRIKWLPIIITDILSRVSEYNAELLARDPNAKTYDMSDLVNLSRLIVKKKLKKLTKNDVDPNLAFDCLCVIPKTDIMEVSINYRISRLNSVMYEHAKTKKVPYGTIIETLIDSKYYPSVCLFTLLERKEKFGTLNDSQKSLYLDISTWTLNYMEKEMSDSELMGTFKAYLRNCSRDDLNGKGGNRRHALSTLSASDYPRIAAITEKMIANDESNRKYL